MSRYQITRLPSGLRVVTAEMPELESLSIGLWVGVGSRHEPNALAGISHFIEHLLFKGTHHRSARQISCEIEGIGGYLNAFTGEETTCFYAKASHRFTDTMLDVLGDMYLHARLARADVDKERTVIKEELLMYRDQPQQYVHELLTETLWPGHPLGRAVAGTPRSLDAIDRTAVRHYLQRRYSAPNTVIAAAGRCRHDELVAKVRARLPLTRRAGAPRFVPARTRQRGPRLTYLSKEVEQAHLALALRAYSRYDSRRYVLRLLSVVLGENMSSRLFQSIRERHGLAYAIQSATCYFADTGGLMISAGLDPKRLARAVRLIMTELRRLAQRAPSAAELRRAKDYSIGQMWLGLESSTNQMMWLGEHLLAYDGVDQPAEIEKRVLAITAGQVHAVAADLFQNHRLNAAIISPGKREAELRRVLRFG